MMAAAARKVFPANQVLEDDPDDEGPGLFD